MVWKMQFFLLLLLLPVQNYIMELFKDEYNLSLNALWQPVGGCSYKTAPISTNLPPWSCSPQSSFRLSKLPSPATPSIIIAIDTPGGIACLLS